MRLLNTLINAIKPALSVESNGSSLSSEDEAPLRDDDECIVISDTEEDPAVKVVQPKLNFVKIRAKKTIIHAPQETFEILEYLGEESEKKCNKSRESQAMDVDDYILISDDEEDQRDFLQIVGLQSKITEPDLSDKPQQLHEEIKINKYRLAKLDFSSPAGIIMGKLKNSIVDGDYVDNKVAHYEKYCGELRDASPVKTKKTKKRLKK